MNVMDMGVLYGIEIEIVLRILLAAALGALVGFEREQRRKPAGIRTNALVCLGACLFTVVSITTFTMEPARLVAGIVTGIGFLGAGTIIGHGKHVKGITTAATLWVVAGIGLAVGVGEYTMAIVTAIVVFFILLLKDPEEKIKMIQRKI